MKWSQVEGTSGHLPALFGTRGNEKRRLRLTGRPRSNACCLQARVGARLVVAAAVGLGRRELPRGITFRQITVPGRTDSAAGFHRTLRPALSAKQTLSLSLAANDIVVNVDSLIEKPFGRVDLRQQRRGVDGDLIQSHSGERTVLVRWRPRGSAAKITRSSPWKGENYCPCKQEGPHCHIAVQTRRERALGLPAGGVACLLGRDRQIAMLERREE